ncbi:MAG TPA: MOSC domain-containing protein [Methylococcaceae bacterium]|jgi:MOSC domain-containing protein YiiM|nr:MOSC domain-containing protein [Methylococcaceae bacterium]
MELLAINLSGLKKVAYKDRWIDTGIYKEPVQGAIRLTECGLEGDGQADLKNHGGPDKAVYVYTLENYRYWEWELGRDLPFGQFGENFTVTGMPDEAVHIGDIFRIGEVKVQVSQPRVPCFKLGIKMEDPAFVGRFHHSGRVGFYLRVLQQGVVTAGDAIELLEAYPAKLSIGEAMLALNKGPRQREIIDRALEIPALSDAWRQDLQKRGR